MANNLPPARLEFHEEGGFADRFRALAQQFKGTIEEEKKPNGCILFVVTYPDAADYFKLGLDTYPLLSEYIKYKIKKQNDDQIHPAPDGNNS